MKKSPRVAFVVTPERLCEIINESFNCVNPDGSPGIFTVEMAEKILKLPEFIKLLPSLPDDVIVCGRDGR
jgi:hypothetical protein